MANLLDAKILSVLLQNQLLVAWSKCYYWYSIALIPKICRRKDQTESWEYSDFALVQFLLTKARLAEFNISCLFHQNSISIFSLNKILIYSTFIFSKIMKFSKILKNELVNKKSYQVRMDRMHLRLFELQVKNKKTWQIRKQGQKKI